MRLARVACVILLLALAAPAAGNFVPIDNGVPIVAPDGPNVTVTGNTNVSLNDSTATFPNANSVYINTTAGNANFTSTGQINVTVNKDDLEGTFTNVTNLDVVGTELTIDPDDKAQASVKGETDAFAFRKNITADDDTVDFFYNGTSGKTTVTVRGLAANTEYRAVDQTGTELASAISDSNGVVTFARMDNSDHSVKIQEEAGPAADDEVQDTTDDSIAPEPVTRQTLLLLLGITLVASYLVLSKPLEVSPAMRVLGGGFVVVLWALVAFWANNYAIVHLSGGQTVRSNEVLSLLAVVGGMVQLLDVMKSAFGLIQREL